MTSRTRKYGEAYDEFEVFGARFTITDVKKMQLKDVRDKYWREEGFDEPIGFVHMWGEIHPKKGFDPEQWVWVHTFKRVEE